MSQVACHREAHRAGRLSAEALSGVEGATADGDPDQGLKMPDLDCFVVSLLQDSSQ
ncbi:MAG TPA: hypothetical protein VMD31_06365 [Opitutaceae bacterium]|nr:hypothetical protein [Opitutaceae bacterium]